MSINAISRRQMFVRSAATAAAIGLSISITAAAKKAKAKVDPEPDPSKDNDTLNALLAAEYDAIATYTAGAGLIASSAVTLEDTAAVKKIVTDVAVHFRSQHSEHAAALKKLIEENGGTPVADDGNAKLPASFPSTGVTTFDVAKLATDKEKAAAFTYAQVMEGITTQTAAKLIASIGAVETQHFVVLHLLVDGLVSPTKFAADNPTLVVPAAFILDVGAAGTVNLEKFPALDDLLAFDVA